jgi:putative Mn2+ efflux pump MntP
MGTIEVFLIALGLAMDCFAVSIACGLVMNKFRFAPVFSIAFLFGLFGTLDCDICSPGLLFVGENTF